MTPTLDQLPMFPIAQAKPIADNSSNPQSTIHNPQSTISSASPYSLILDIETLSRRPNAVITEIGLLVFERQSFAEVAALELLPGIFPQITIGRHICPETLRFHTGKGTLPTSVGAADPVAAIAQMAAFIAHHKPHRVWIQGPDFDRPILEDFFLQYGSPMPWEYFRTMDTRTTWNLAFPDTKHAPRPHHAIPDCRATLQDLKRSLIALMADAA